MAHLRTTRCARSIYFCPLSIGLFVDADTKLVFTLIHPQLSTPYFQPSIVTEFRRCYIQGNGTFFREIQENIGLKKQNKKSYGPNPTKKIANCNNSRAKLLPTALKLAFV